MKILVVDPMAPSRTLTCHNLKVSGYDDVTPANDGQSALQLLNDQSFDLAVIDWHLTDISPPQMVKQIRASQSGAKMPLLMSVKETDLSHVTEALKEGANGYIMQPASIGALAEKIASLCNT